jgi:hypothetical protein
VNAAGGFGRGKIAIILGRAKGQEILLGGTKSFDCGFAKCEDYVDGGDRQDTICIHGVKKLISAAKPITEHKRITKELA